MKSKVAIRCLIQNLAQARIDQMIAPDTLSRIKAKDPNPKINVYVIGHEGEANAKEVGFGRRVMQYFRNAIVQLGNRVAIGLKAFHHHNHDNSHEGRKSIGEVVGKSLEMIEGKLHSLAAIYIYPDFKDIKLDAASIEAEIEYVQDGENSEVLSVNEVTGIALADIEKATPAFAGATLLGQVQNMIQKSSQQYKGEDMTKEEILEAIRKANLKITDLFSADEIVESEPAKKAKQTEYEHAKRVEKKLGEERDNVKKLTEENENLSTKVKELSSVASSAKVNDLFSKAKETRGLKDQQMKFIEKNLKTFKSEEDDDAKVAADFDRFVDAQLKEFKDYAEIYGIKVDDDNKNQQQQQQKKGTGADDENHQQSDEEGSKYESPKENDFIPQPVE